MKPKFLEIIEVKDKEFLIADTDTGI